MKKTEYFFRSVLNYSSPKICPYCRSKENKVVDSKFIVTTLNQCKECNLLFRHPMDTIKFNRKFYQNEYEQNDGITTSLPSDAELQKLKDKNFVGSAKDFSEKLRMVKTLVKSGIPKIVDYGANWGYASYQFKQQGFDVQSYEISKPRAGFGEKLGVTIFTSEDELKPGVDIFFSSHVIEHVPDIKSMFLLAQRLLKDDGFFVAYCPNASFALKEKNPALFHRFWGQVHPNCLSAEFFSTVFKDVPYLIGSDSARGIEEWDQQSQKLLDLSGNELFVFARIKKQKF